MFEAAAASLGLPPDKLLHAGDDAEADHQGALNADFHAFHVDRPTTSLHDLCTKLGL